MALVQHCVQWGTSFSLVSEMHWAWRAPKPPEFGILCILELMKHARRFPDVYHHPVMRRAEGSCQRTRPILDGMVPIYPALPCPGSFGKAQKCLASRAPWPGPFSPQRSQARASRPMPRGFGRNSGASASPQTQAREEVPGGLQPPRATPEGSTRTGKGGGNTGATVTEAVRCPGGHRGATSRPAGAAGRRPGPRRNPGRPPRRRGERRRGAAPRPGAPLKTTTERCGLAFPLPAGRGRDGISALAAAASSPRRPPGSAPRSCPALTCGPPRPPAPGPSPALGGLRGSGGTAAGAAGRECLSCRRVRLSVPVASPLAPRRPRGLPRRHEHQRRLPPAHQHPGPHGAG